MYAETRQSNLQSHNEMQSLLTNDRALCWMGPNTEKRNLPAAADSSVGIALVQLRMLLLLLQCYSAGATATECCCGCCSPSPKGLPGLAPGGTPAMPNISRSGPSRPGSAAGILQGQQKVQHTPHTQQLSPLCQLLLCRRDTSTTLVTSYHTYRGVCTCAVRRGYLQ